MLKRYFVGVFFMSLTIVIAATGGVVAGKRIACDDAQEPAPIELENCTRMDQWEACNEEGVVTYLLRGEVAAVFDDSVLIFLEGDQFAPNDPGRYRGGLPRAGGGRLFRWTRQNGANGLAVETNAQGKAINITVW